MGRKGEFKDKPKRGPGRKAKKQKPPQLPTHLQAERDPTFVSRRAKKRLNKQKRASEQHEKETREKLSEMLESVDDDEQYEDDDEKIIPKNQELLSENDDSDDDEQNIEKQVKKKGKIDKKSKLFSDDNTEWLKPKSSKQELFQDTDNEEEEEDQDLGRMADDSDDDDDVLGDEFNADSSGSDENDLLPIEKKAKKLAKKEAELKKLEEAELQSNLAVLNQRVKDIAHVLADFQKRREENRSRVEYMNQLKADLCSYYNYNEFMMEKLMELFPPNEKINSSAITGR
ncbi:putative ribosomal RNA methyltransferase NOP2 [Caerostris extrusa]|uniref:Ribosomal RNA methyltransferase NOP2 n=1 Tax=Caerostris extrusa TaxID=172846 RepID=A0AAV4R6B3_CAEEX|nr:putative ribosomal RNA methyltransferase NOP2 [Caerostris extrusa]